MREAKIDFPVLGTLSARRAIFVVELCRDFAVRRAAECVGRSAEWGYSLMNNDEQVQAAILGIVKERQKSSDIDADWLLKEAVANHFIARQMGNVGASNAALLLIARLKQVDALASDKLNVNLDVDKEVIKRLNSGRTRAALSGIEDAIIVAPTPPKALEVVPNFI